MIAIRLSLFITPWQPDCRGRMPQIPAYGVGPNSVVFIR